MQSGSRCAVGCELSGKPCSVLQQWAGADSLLSVCYSSFSAFLLRQTVCIAKESLKLLARNEITVSLKSKVINQTCKLI